MKKQVILSLYSKVIISFFIVLLVAFSLLSVNKYSDSYEYQKELLGKIRLSSDKLHAEILEVRGGFVLDYDGLVKKSTSINQLLSSLPKDSEFSGGWLSSKERIKVPYSDAVSALSKRILLVEDFKTNFSVFRNSRLIVFQLIADLRQMYADNLELNSDLNDLETEALKAVNAMSDRDNGTIDASLVSIRDRHKDSYDDIDEFLGFIIGHFQIINSRESIITEIVKDEVLLSKAFNQYLDVFESELDEEYRQHSESSSMYRFYFAVVALAILVYGVFQAMRSGKLAGQLLVQNENLEEIVAKRTETLELTTNNLQIEQKEREKNLLELKESREMLDAIINNIQGCVYEYDVVSDSLSYMSRGAEDIWGVSAREMSNREDLRRYIHPDDLSKVCGVFEEAQEQATPFNLEYRVVKKTGDQLWVREIGMPIVEGDTVKSAVCLVSDINEFKKAGEDNRRIQEELNHAQKMESVGQLAAGVAHEINTPAQFISDNLVFLQESASEIISLLKDIETEVEGCADDSTKQVISDLLDEADMEYLAEEVPQALSQSAGGIERIATIVRAMKDYSHPGESLEFTDLNAALQSTIIVSKSEWKYFAKLETDFDENLPLVECVVGDVNQVVLNMIVNAAHAIVDKFDDPENLSGLIRVRTKSLGEEVSIEISDNGAGMPDSVKNRIFDQFFTTKEVGKGTGQGLSIAYRLIAENHGGKIEVDSEPGEGTTFRIILPVSQPKGVSN